MNSCHVHGEGYICTHRERRAAESPGHRERTIGDRVHCACVNRDRMPIKIDWLIVPALVLALYLRFI